MSRASRPTIRDHLAVKLPVLNKSRITLVCTAHTALHHQAKNTQASRINEVGRKYPSATARSSIISPRHLANPSSKSGIPPGKRHWSATFVIKWMGTANRCFIMSVSGGPLGDPCRKSYQVIAPELRYDWTFTRKHDRWSTHQKKMRKTRKE